LEFWLPEGVSGRACSDGTSTSKVGDCLYDTVADVALQTDDITILDIGLLVYSESSSALRSALPRSPRIAVQLGLGVDPFFYFERLSKVAGVPPLIYSWKILSILRQTAPLIEVDEVGPSTGRKVLVRDPQRLGYEAVRKTDAWKDDDGHGDYVLRCNLLPIPPKRVSATAT
jgi:hypothetical protein